MKTKLCTKCNRRKSLGKFSKSKSKSDGLQYRCKVCDKAYQQTHKVEIAKYNKKYYQVYKIAERREKRRRTIKGCLRDRFHAVLQRCNNSNHKRYSQYGGEGVKCLFKSFTEFYNHVVIDLGYNTYESIKGLQIHRTKQHYEKWGIEFKTKAEHIAIHKELRRKQKRK